MPFKMIFEIRLAAIAMCIAILGCGGTKPEGPVGPKGKKEARLVRPIDPPNESGKAVLDELGVTVLKPSNKISEKSKNAAKDKQNSEDAIANKTSEPEYRRPTKWVNSDELPFEFWEVQYLGNRPVGYLHQRVSPSAIGSAGIYRIDAESFIRVTRVKQRFEQRLKVTSIEEVDGRLKTIEANLKQGALETKIEGSVILGSLRLKIQANEKASGVDVPWSNEFGGPFAVAQSLRGKKMEPGEIRNLSMLDPVLGQVVRVRLQAKEYLKTPLMDGLQHNLLEITSEVTLDDKSLASTLWVNKSGETLKTYTSALDIRSFRTERSFAEGIRDAVLSESLAKTKIVLETPIDDYEAAKSLVFKIRHPDLDPKRLIPGRTNQSVKSITTFSANVTVFAMQEKSTLPDGVSPELQADPMYSSPSQIIQSDDDVVKKLAAKFFDDKELGKSVLDRLRRGVYNWIDKKIPYSPTLSSAAEVARNKSGSSIEHAILFAAIVRARNVPSRVAMGVIYNGSREEPALVFHAWTEVYLKDHWVSIDASVEKASTNATYFKFVDTPFVDQNPYAPLLASLQIIDLMDISLVE